MYKNATEFVIEVRNKKVKVNAHLENEYEVQVTDYPYWGWKESPNYELEDFYGPLARDLGVIITSKWKAVNEDDPIDSVKGGWVASYVELYDVTDDWPVSPEEVKREVGKQYKPRTYEYTQWLKELEYKEGDYSHYIFQVAGSFLYQITRGEYGTNWCPPHIGYYRWKEVNSKR